MSALSQRLMKAKDEKDLTNRKIADAVGLAPATVDRMMNGTGQPDVESLDAVAEFLGVPISEARQLRGLPSGAKGPYVAPAESRLLSNRQRRALDNLIRSIVDTASGNGSQDSPSFNPGWGVPDDQDPGMDRDEDRDESG